MARSKESKEQRAKYSRDAWRRNRSIVVEAKTGPCIDCNVQYPVHVMQLDHRPEHKKSFALSKMATRGEKLIREEIAKCDLVCANCHAERTYQRFLIAGVDFTY